MTASSAASIPAAGTGLTDSRLSTSFSRSWAMVMGSAVQARKSGTMAAMVGT